MKLLNHPKVYEPREDSWLLAEIVKKKARGRVLDMGTGSGIQAIVSSKNAKEIIATDINPYAIEIAKENAKSNNIKNIKFKLGNLFQPINKKNKFDLIVFNPPYLPKEGGLNNEIERAITGGKKGYELLVRFLKLSKNYLKKDGEILVVISSRTNPKLVLRNAKSMGYRHKVLDKMKLSFEELYVLSFNFK